MVAALAQSLAAGSFSSATRWPVARSRIARFRPPMPGGRDTGHQTGVVWPGYRRSDRSHPAGVRPSRRQRVNRWHLCFRVVKVKRRQTVHADHDDNPIGAPPSGGAAPAPCPPPPQAAINARTKQVKPIRPRVRRINHFLIALYDDTSIGRYDTLLSRAL